MSPPSALTLCSPDLLIPKMSSAQEPASGAPGHWAVAQDPGTQLDNTGVLERRRAAGPSGLAPWFLPLALAYPLGHWVGSRWREWRGAHLTRLVSEQHWVCPAQPSRSAISILSDLGLPVCPACALPVAPFSPAGKCSGGSSSEGCGHYHMHSK